MTCLTGHVLVGSVPAVGTNQWAAGPALIEARAGATATSLGDGNVLVTGGRGASGPLASVELLTSNGTAVPVAAMSLARAEHTAALLGDTGNILVAGGTTVVATEEGTAEVVTGSVEVFDAAAAAWYPVGSLSHPRAGATAVALPEGRIAIVGGHDASGPVLEIEIYDPAAGAFGPGGATSAPRAGAAVTSTRDGHIVVVGGSVAGVAQATADIIDPVGGTVATVILTSPRTGASATTTVEDQVLIAGGFDGTTTLATTEVLDPVTGNSASGATLSAARTDHRAYLLPHNGGVLLVGGSNAGGLVAASELVIPWVNTCTGAYRRRQSAEQDRRRGRPAGRRLRRGRRQQCRRRRVSVERLPRVRDGEDGQGRLRARTVRDNHGQWVAAGRDGQPDVARSRHRRAGHTAERGGRRARRNIRQRLLGAERVAPRRAVLSDGDGCGSDGAGDLHG